eukprot:Colp12_sorted_trinity150504_noHs@6819
MFVSALNLPGSFVGVSGQVRLLSILDWQAAVLLSLSEIRVSLSSFFFGVSLEGTLLIQGNPLPISVSRAYLSVSMGVNPRFMSDKVAEAAKSLSSMISGGLESAKNLLANGQRKLTDAQMQLDRASQQANAFYERSKQEIWGVSDCDADSRKLYQN